MHKCPSCNNKGISFLDFYYRSTVINPATCKLCGKSSYRENKFNAIFSIIEIISIIVTPIIFISIFPNIGISLTAILIVGIILTIGFIIRLIKASLNTLIVLKENRDTEKKNGISLTVSLTVVIIILAIMYSFMQYRDANNIGDIDELSKQKTGKKIEDFFPDK